MSLRPWIRAAVAVGVFALAGVTLSFAADRPASRGAGNDTTLVRIGTGNSQTAAFVALPANPQKAPVVVVVQEWWGLNAQIRDVAQRLARQGYIAIVPDLYHGRLAEDAMQAHELSRSVTDEGSARDLAAATAWVRAQPFAAGKLGVMGFCLGGGVALQYALRTPDLAAVVMFYGTPETDSDRLAALRAPLQGHFGADDKGIPVDRVEAFRGALQRAKESADIYVYPGAGHAFMHDGLPSYRPDAAKQAWARTLAFLQKNLKGE
jgi:carboxymethylenebutenolidase